MQFDNEIERLESLLKASQDSYYPYGCEDDRLTPDEHFAIWDKMWNLLKISKYKEN